ncbi:MAG: Rieske (2Fe-2S) protein, partial [Gammaproteobacteria bacterium]|nr:Rieske (2Fe-2S) protein [Gammaproteobacteria bacterium]
MDKVREVKVPRVDPEDSPETPAEKAPDPELGTEVIPASRYTSAEFMRLEWEHIWSKVWLLGCREDDIPEPGDYACTEIGRESVLIVRQPDGGVRAFYNVCQHRGNRLRSPGYGSANTFKCSYHHWEYRLDGS